MTDVESDNPKWPLLSVGVCDPRNWVKNPRLNHFLFVVQTSKLQFYLSFICLKTHLHLRSVRYALRWLYLHLEFFQVRQTDRQSRGKKKQEEKVFVCFAVFPEC